MKRILRDRSGMALGVVLAIMAVVAVLTTGAFYFSYNELGFARLDVRHAQADYLARAGVEIASKSFWESAGRFPFTVVPTPADELVTMGPLYLHAPAAEGEEPGFSAEADGSIGEVTVEVGQDWRFIGRDGGGEPSKYLVWTYAATARVGSSQAKAQGFSMPVAYVVDDGAPEDGKIHLPWIDVPSGSGTAQAVQPSAAPLKTIPVSSVTGNKNIPYYQGEAYSGVVVLSEDTASILSMPPGGDKAYGWVAQTLSIETPIDLRQTQAVNALILSASTLVFEKEIHLYTNQYQPRMGNVVLSAQGKAEVHFKSDVYLHVGSSQIKIFPGGTAYQFGGSGGRSDIDLIQYATDAGLVPRGIQGWLEGIFGSSRTKYVEADMAKLPGDAAAPSVNSLIEVVWEPEVAS